MHYLLSMSIHNFLFKFHYFFILNNFNILKWLLYALLCILNILLTLSIVYNVLSCIINVPVVNTLEQSFFSGKSV